MNTTGLAAQHLEDLLNNAEIYLDKDILSEECKCEMKHRIVKCSIKVTHLITFCTGSALMCFNAATGRTEAMKAATCSYCLRPASECWSIRPV